jgi:hypothetical protein
MLPVLGKRIVLFGKSNSANLKVVFNCAVKTGMAGLEANHPEDMSNNIFIIYDASIQQDGKQSPEPTVTTYRTEVAETFAG